ncbi:ComF family protein [Rhizobium sp. TRM95111]|uniref:ComF family protein n=1 Tax=Rhizobium alarense TaxID=2846851 RepID=UPI001F3443CB|nr:ComF family protein [Rhizobium alarense]MCF3642205.1 ComF family protein [Rhizobium alarense]
MGQGQATIGIGGRLRARIGGIRHTLLDAVYPPTCAGCGIILAGSHGLCAGCWSSLQFIERPYCEILGTPFVHDLGPHILSAEAIANPPPFDRLRSAVLYDGHARTLVQGLKYRDRTDLAPMMAGWMLRAADGALAGADLVLPVPLHRSRLVWRKFNQAAELARHLSGASGKPALFGALIRSRRTRRQVGLGSKAREDNVRGAFVVTQTGRAELFGKRVVLVDDVYTTGATAAAASRALKRAGTIEVTVLTFARALPGPI